MSNIYYTEEDGIFFQQDGEKILTNINLEPSVFHTLVSFHDIDPKKEYTKAVYNELMYLKEIALYSFKLQFSLEDVENIISRCLNNDK